MKKLLFSFITAVFLFTSCDNQRVFDHYKSLPQEGWQKDSAVSFQVKDLDTLKRYNLFINLRNNNEYKYSNLFLITQMNFPNGKVISDTLEYEMANPDGSWLGKGMGNMKENKLWYKEGVRFPEVGTYQIQINQAMRKNGKVNGVPVLEGITEVGFRIENHNQQ